MKQKDKLRATWSKGENDVMLHWPAGINTSGDGNYLSGIFSRDFVEEMKSRGYDITTLKFSIDPDVKDNPDKFPSLAQKYSPNPHLTVKK